MCSCNSRLGPGNPSDWALLTASMGTVKTFLVNPSLDGTGSTPVLTGTGNGTIIRSVTIKAVEPVPDGMVRLFIKSAGGVYTLYKEVPVSTTPDWPNTPTPQPPYEMFCVKLEGGLKLQSGSTLTAATVNGHPFNIIAEGLSWSYSATLNACCNYYQETANTGQGVVTTVNFDPNGLGGVLILTAGATNGTLIKSVTIKAMQSTGPGVVRLCVGATVGTTFLVKEIVIPQTTQSGFQPSFKQVIDLDLNIPANWVLVATTTVTQSFAVTAEAVDWDYAI